MVKLLVAAFAVTLLTAVLPAAAQSPRLDLIEEPGDSMQIKGPGYFLNGTSSLKRKFFALNNPVLPVTLFEWFGVTATVRDGRLVYAANVKLKASAPVRAIDVRFLLFDVFGRYVETLQMEVVTDIAAGGEYSEFADWKVSSTTAAAHFGSVTYIAAVRTDDGRVLETPRELVLVEAAKLFGRVDEKARMPRRKDKDEPLSTAALSHRAP